MQTVKNLFPPPPPPPHTHTQLCVTIWLILSSDPGIYLDFTNIFKTLHDCLLEGAVVHPGHFEVGVVRAVVFLPVVIPVAILVSTVAKQGHLGGEKGRIVEDRHGMQQEMQHNQVGSNE